ncbi:MAG: hypothetical protein NVV60_09235 [Luteimonas sp.]|nr:hypothetical protein [Luteimonas sp.]
MAWQWIALVVAAALVPLSLHLHRGQRDGIAKAVDVVALAWLFYLVNLVADGSQWLLGLLMFMGCFHLGMLMGWAPIRREPG